MPTGQLDPDSPSLSVFSEVILDCVPLTIQMKHHGSTVHACKGSCHLEKSMSKPQCLQSHANTHSPPARPPLISFPSYSEHQNQVTKVWGCAAQHLQLFPHQQMGQQESGRGPADISLPQLGQKATRVCPFPPTQLLLASICQSGTSD